MHGQGGESLTNGVVIAHSVAVTCTGTQLKERSLVRLGYGGLQRSRDEAAFCLPFQFAGETTAGISLRLEPQEQSIPFSVVFGD